MDEDCRRKVATGTYIHIYTDHENMKTIYFLILNEIVEYFIKILKVCLCNIHITLKFVSSNLFYIN